MIYTRGSNGFAPKNVFMGLPLYDPMYVILAPSQTTRRIRQLAVTSAEFLTEFVGKLQADLSQMHRKVEERNMDRRDRNLRHRDNAMLRISRNNQVDSTLFGRYQATPGSGDVDFDKKYFYDSVNFHEGDFVL